MRLVKIYYGGNLLAKQTVSKGLGQLCILHWKLAFYKWFSSCFIGMALNVSFRDIKIEFLMLFIFSPFFAALVIGFGFSYFNLAIERIGVFVLKEDVNVMHLGQRLAYLNLKWTGGFVHVSLLQVLMTMTILENLDKLFHQRPANIYFRVWYLSSWVGYIYTSLYTTK